MKIRLAVLETDNVYLRRFVSVLNAKYADKLEVYSFTEKETALLNVEERKIDVFLVNDSFNIDMHEIPKRCAFAYFVDSKEVEIVRDQPAICKFQKIELIYKQILSIYSEKATYLTGIHYDDETSTKIISFFSASGGMGSSTAAGAFCNLTASRGEKVLYLNLDPLGDPELMFRGQGNFSFSDVVYALKSKKANLFMKIESAVKQAQSGVYYFSAPAVALDMMELKEDNIARLLNELRMFGNYKYMVIDAKYYFDKKSNEIWRNSNEIVLVSDGSVSANSKLNRFLAAMAICMQEDETIRLDKAHLLYNRFSSKMSRKAENIEIRELGTIPRIEHASILNVMEQMKTYDFWELLM